MTLRTHAHAQIHAVAQRCHTVRSPKPMLGNDSAHTCSRSNPRSRTALSHGALPQAHAWQAHAWLWLCAHMLTLKSTQSHSAATRCAPPSPCLAMILPHMLTLCYSVPSPAHRCSCLTVTVCERFVFRSCCNSIFTHNVSCQQEFNAQHASCKLSTESSVFEAARLDKRAHTMFNAQLSCYSRGHEQHIPSNGSASHPQRHVMRRENTRPRPRE
jgi:hypothetical protein